MGSHTNQITGAGANYVVMFIDDYSRYTVIYFLASKSEMFEKFVEHIALMENQKSKRIKCILNRQREDTSTRSSHSFVDMPESYTKQLDHIRLSETVWLSE